MLNGAPLRLGPLAAPLRQCLAAVAMFAQCLMVIAPPADARDSAAAPPSIATAWEMGRASLAVDTQHSHPHRHNPATCPACIAQTLLAVVGGTVGGPPLLAGERVNMLVMPEGSRHSSLLVLPPSRAPPHLT